MVFLAEIFGNIRDFFELGGPVLWFILLDLVIMWTLIIERFWFYAQVHPKRFRSTVSAWEARYDTTSWQASQVRLAMISEMRVDLRRNIGLIQTLIALCPLLGLLGTVYGMIVVFDVMSVFGTGNARAMASGVSQATVPTMAGMVAALSGVYFAARLDRYSKQEVHRLGDVLQHH